MSGRYKGRYNKEDKPGLGSVIVCVPTRCTGSKLVNVLQIVPAMAFAFKPTKARVDWCFGSSYFLHCHVSELKHTLFFRAFYSLSYSSSPSTMNTVFQILLLLMTYETHTQNLNNGHSTTHTCIRIHSHARK